jgi:uncharacterized membrane protein YphA (DoxX/SURF4 family)
LLNLTGVYLTVWGFHESAGDSSAILKISGLSIVLVTLVSLIILRGFFLYSYVARALVGGLFIVSGVIKANDPMGFAFKLEEYFAPDALSYDYPFFAGFAGYALTLSIIICIAEIVLGVAVIVGGKIKLASWSLVIMMAFFTWLTAYTTNCNDAQLAAMESGAEFHQSCVTDCGCFGDALRGSVGRSLTPYESFWKDLVLFYFVLIIFFNQWKTQMNTVLENWFMVPGATLVLGFFSWVFGWSFPVIFGLLLILGSFVIGNLNIWKIGKPWKMAIFVSLVCLLMSTYTTLYLPFKDYRPYAVGNNIRDEMNKGVPQISDWVLIYKELSTGKEVEFKLDDWEIYGDTTKYKFVDRKETVIQAGVDAPIKDFNASIAYEDLTEEERKIPYIDSVINAEIGNYYEEYMVATSEWGSDTISVLEYDPEFYPDSIYTISPKATRLIDANNTFKIDLTNFILDQEFIFMMTLRKIEEADADHIADLKKVADGAKEKGIPFVVLTPASDEEIVAFKAKHKFDAMFLTFDATEIKIIIRSNPGLLLLNRATVLDMWPCRSIEDFEDIYSEYIAKK